MARSSGGDRRIALALAIILAGAQGLGAAPARAGSGVPSAATLSWTDTVIWPETEPVVSSTTTMTWDTRLASNRIELGESVEFQEKWTTVLTAVQRYPVDCPGSHGDTTTALASFSLIRAPFVAGRDNQFLEFAVEGGTEHTVSSAGCVTTQVKTYTGTIPGSATQGTATAGCWYLTPVGSGPQDKGTFSGTAASVAIGVDPATCTPGNHPPVAVDDGPVVVSAVPPSHAGDRALAVSFTPLDNDFDPDGDPIKIVSVTSAPDGTTWRDPDDPATVWYLPNAGFTGNDGFLYTIADDRGLTAEGTVRVSVEGDVPTQDMAYECGDGQIRATYVGEWAATEAGVNTLKFKVTFPWCYGNGGVTVLEEPEATQAVGEWVLPEWFQPIKFRADDSVVSAQWHPTGPGAAEVQAGGRFEACVNAIEIVLLVSGLGEMKALGIESLWGNALKTARWAPKPFRKQFVARIFNPLKLWTLKTTGLALARDPMREQVVEALGNWFDLSVEKFWNIVTNQSWDAVTETPGLFDACEETWLPEVTIPLLASGVLGAVTLGDRFDPFWTLKQVAP